MTQAIHRERGAILPFSLLLLLALTLLGLVSIRGTLVQTADLRQQVIRQLSFENAEAALREAEGLLADPARRAALAWDGRDGSYPAEALDHWQPWQGSSLAALAVNPEAPATRYCLERLGVSDDPGCVGQLYRVTAYTPSGATAAAVILQATVFVPAQAGADCAVRRTSWNELANPQLRR